MLNVSQAVNMGITTKRNFRSHKLCQKGALYPQVNDFLQITRVWVTILHFLECAWDIVFKSGHHKHKKI